MAVDIDLAKAHVGIDWTQSAEQEALCVALLGSAKAAVERRAQTILEERAVVQRFDGLVDRRGCSTLRLAWAPVVSVEGIDYLDADGVSASLLEADGDFRIVAGIPCLLLPPVDGSWPTVLGEPGSVSVRYTAGYGGALPDGAGPSPGDLDAAVLMMFAHLYHNREAVVTGTIATELPLGVGAFCDAHRHTLLG